MLENATPRAAFNTDCLLLGTVVKSQSVQKLEGGQGDLVKPFPTPSLKRHNHQ
jgi:hypothetical protein